MFAGIMRCSLREGLGFVIGRRIKKTGTLYSHISCKASMSEMGCIFGRTTTTLAVKNAAAYHSIQIKILKSCQMSKPSSVIVRFFSQAGGKLPYERDFKITKNTLVYSNRNERFYKLLSYFGAIQFVFWSYLGMFCYSSLRDVSYNEQEKADTDNAPWWRLINLGKNKYKNGITLLCFSVGYIILFITVMYPLRAVNSLWLLKGGKSVGITTYAPFGKKISVVAPLENINCVQSRSQAKSQVPLKIKGKWFFYLLDHKGVYHNPELFDYTVGLKRNIK